MDEFAPDEQKHGFMFFYSFYEALRELDDERRLKLYDAITLYGIERKAPTLDDPICKAVFAALRPNIDSSIKARASGKKGGESRGKSKHPSNDSSSTLPKIPQAPFEHSSKHPSECGRSKRREGEVEGKEKEREENITYTPTPYNDTEKRSGKRNGAGGNSEREKPLDWHDLSKGRLH